MQAGDVVATTQILCKQEGVVQFPIVQEGDPIRRLIVERDEDTAIRQVKGKPIVTVGQRLVDGDLLTKEESVDCCGEV